jgi:hypothetical protein
MTGATRAPIGERLLAESCKRRFVSICDRKATIENSFIVPDAALADVPASLSATAEPARGRGGSAGNGIAPRGRL